MNNLKLIVGLASGLFLFSLPLMAQENVRRQEQQAFYNATAACADSIVRIETIGGVDLVGDLITATGPTTGVIVHEDGYILTSRFNFISRPASVLVMLPDQRRFAAEIVANDLSRMLTLLKIDATGLKPMVATPKSEMKVGQWAIALGRTFDPEFPNMSVGMVSALNRVWGRAIQTDAKTSPINYGGPLIDLSGRCLGIIVPLSPQEQGETAGVEWYDSGIGFAVPLEDIQLVLDRMIAGETLKPGLMGVSFEESAALAGEPKIIRVRPNSPADQAGILVDDVVQELNGQPVSKLYEVRHFLGSRYAKETLQITLRRGEETIQQELTLADELQAYQYPWLGILPHRESLEASAAGVQIRMVEPDSPAAEAGLKEGDVIVNNKTVAELGKFLRQHNVGAEVALKLLRDGQEETVSATLKAFPNSVPEALEAFPIPTPKATPEAALGRLNEQLPAEGPTFWAYVPDNYRSDYEWGLLVWLHPSTDNMEAEMLRSLPAMCRERGYLIVAPRAGDVAGWTPEMEQPIEEVVNWMKERYRIDANRIVAVGRGDSGTFATRVAFKYRSLFRGLALIESPLRVPPPDSDPDYSLQFAFFSTEDSAHQDAIQLSAEFLQQAHFPVNRVTFAELDASKWTPELVESLAIWLDVIDRL